MQLVWTCMFVAAVILASRGEGNMKASLDGEVVETVTSESKPKNMYNNDREQMPYEKEDPSEKYKKEQQDYSDEDSNLMEAIQKDEADDNDREISDYDSDTDIEDEVQSKEREKHSPARWSWRRRRSSRRRRRWSFIDPCRRRRVGPTNKFTNRQTPQAKDWIPVLYFDGSAGGYCFPDVAIDSNDYKCRVFNSNSPVYYEKKHCSSSTYKIAYWWWYGLQKACFGKSAGRHGNDWEHVVLTFNKQSNRWNLNKVTFSQHDGHYSRRIGTFGMEGNRVIVYVGKIAHGNYHTGCKGVGVTWCPQYCAGGCGYWEDFRNNNGNYRLRSTNLKHMSSVTGKITGRIARSNQNYCKQSNCAGSKLRLVKSAGCWQNMV